MSSGRKDKSRIANPRRLLILTPSTQSLATIPPFLHALTGVPVTDAPTASSQRPSTQPTSNDAEGHLSEKEAGDGLPTFAGYTTHEPLRLDTRYYKADIPIWVDEVPFPSSPQNPADATTSATTSTEPTTTTTSTSSLASWKSDFLGPEACEVRDAVGAILLCICSPDRVSSAVPTRDAVAEQRRKDVDAQIERFRQIIAAVADVKARIDEERAGMGDVAALLVLVGSKKREKVKTASGRGDDGSSEAEGRIGAEEFGPAWWDEELSGMGIFDFETVSWHPTEQEGNENTQNLRNEFGELEGMARIREVLEANEWNSRPNNDQGGILDETDDQDGFDIEADELEREMLDLRIAIENEHDEEDELKVEQMEALMSRVKAIRDMSSEMPASERKQFAAKAIRDIMKDL